MFVARAQIERRGDPDDPVMRGLAEMREELEGLRMEVAKLSRTE
jgi:hypothetical protein